VRSPRRESGAALITNLEKDVDTWEIYTIINIDAGLLPPDRQSYTGKSYPLVIPEWRTEYSIRTLYNAKDYYD
jgi:hypothetical protein